MFVRFPLPPPEEVLSEYMVPPNYHKLQWFIIMISLEWQVGSIPTETNAPQTHHITCLICTILLVKKNHQISCLRSRKTPHNTKYLLLKSPRVPTFFQLPQRSTPACRVRYRRWRRPLEAAWNPTHCRRPVRCLWPSDKAEGQVLCSEKPTEIYNYIYILLYYTYIYIYGVY